MRSISSSILMALAFASCVATSVAGSVPGDNRIPQSSTTANGGTLNDNPFKHRGISDALPKIVEYLPLHALAAVDQTDTAWNAFIQADIRTKTSLQLAGIIYRAAEGNLRRNPREVHRVGINLAGDLAQIRDQFKSAHAGRGIQPIMLPSCFMIATNHLLACLEYLLFVANYMPDLFAPDWVLVSPKDIVHAILEVTDNRLTISPGHLEFAELQAGQLLSKIDMDGWSTRALSLLIELRAHIQKTHKGLRVQEIISSILCLQVAKGILPHVDYDRKLVRGGVTTLNAILISIVTYLSQQPEVISSDFLQNSMLHHDPSFRYDPLKSKYDCVHSHPSLYDIVRELVRVVTPNISSADRKLLGKNRMKNIQGFIHGTETAAGIAGLMINIEHHHHAFAAINSALLGLHPPPDWLNKDEASRASMVTEWLEWQFRHWMLEHFALKNASFALEVLQHLEGYKLVPDWVDRNILYGHLKNMAQAH